MDPGNPGVRSMQALFAFFFIVIILFLAIVFIIAALGASVLLRGIGFLFTPFRRKRTIRTREVMMGSDGRPVTDVMVKDPVCGLYLPKGDALQQTVGGQTVYFCSQECLSQYKQRA
jgi:uncharacterized protein